METNPISFRQIFNFDDAAPETQKAITAMENLSLTTKQFFDIVTNGNLDKLNAEIADIKQSISAFAKETENANLQTKEGQKTVIDATKGVQDYRAQLDALNGSKGTQVKVSKDVQAAIDSLNFVIGQSIKQLENLEKAEYRSEEAIAKQNARIKEQREQLEGLTKNIQTATGAAGGQTEEMRQLAIVLEKIIVTTAKLNIANTDEVATLTDKTLALQATNKELKLNSLLSDENVGQYQRMKAQKEFLVLQYEQEAEVTSELSIVLKEQIDIVDQWIKANSYQSAQQRLTIGDYKNAREELTLTVERMRELVITGEQLGGEYVRLNARAVELTQANKTVTQSIKEQTNAEERAAAVEKENLRIAALYIQEINNEAAAIEKEGVAAEKASIAAIRAQEAQTAAAEKTTIAYKLQQFVVRDLFRLLAGFLTIIPIMAFLEALREVYGEWTKIGDAEQAAIDKQTEYFEAYKNFKKDQNSESQQILGKAYFNQAEAHTQRDIMRDSETYNLNQRFEAYEKLQGIAPQVLDSMNKENFAIQEHSLRMQDQLKHLDRYIDLQAEISKFAETTKTNQDLVLKNDENQASLRNKLIQEAIKTNPSLSKTAAGKYIDTEAEGLRKAGNTEREANLFGTGANGDFQNSLRDLAKLKQQQIDLNKNLSESYEILDKREKEIAALEGNTKDKKGRSKTKTDKDDMEAELAREKAESEARLLIAQKEFDNSRKTFEDSKALDKAKENEANTHYNNVVGILLKWHGKVGETENKYLARQKDASNESVKVYDANEEALAAIAKEIAARHEQALHDMDAYIARLKAGREEIERLTSELQKVGETDKIKLDRAKSTNLLLAALGVNDTKGDLAASQAEKQAGIDEDLKKIDLSRTDLADEGVKGAGADPKKIQELQAKVIEDATRLKKDSDAKELEMAQALEKGKQAAFQKTFELGVKLANNAFDLTKERIEHQMVAIQKLGEFETQLAGNNATAKLKIERDTQRAVLAEKRKEAEVNKQQAEMNATISTFVAVAKAYEDYPWPFDLVVGALVGAAGLAEVGKIASTPLPQYAKGRTGGPAELARVNEKGPEAIERNGKYLFAGGGKDTVTHLQAGDKVHTHEQTVKMLSTESGARNWMNNLLVGTGAHIQVEQNKQEALVNAIVGAHMSKSDLKNAVYEGTVKAHRNLPKPGRGPLPGQYKRTSEQLQRNGL